MATVEHDTYQKIDVDSPAGRKFLRRVARCSQEAWSMYANAGGGWRVCFTRRIVSTIPGTPSAAVEVSTDAIVSFVGRAGENAPDSGDGDSSVFVPESRWVSCPWSDARAAAVLLADGWRLAVRHSAGSIKSRRHGLAFVSLVATRDGMEVCIGETVYCHGEQILHGPPQC